MKVARILLFVCLVQLQKSSWSLDCPSLPHFNPGQCVCNSRISSDKIGGWEMDCFGDDIFRHAFMIDYAVNRHLIVECVKDASPYAFAMFSKFNISEINTFRFKSCLLPDISFSDILGGYNVYSLTFESRRNITDLSHRHFENLNNLKVLGLQRNGLSSISSNLFRNLTELHELRLYDNRLQLINEDSFDDLLKLFRLEMGSNLLKELPEKVFSQLRNLQYLHLYKNAFVSIPGKIFHTLQSLVLLDLSYNRLQEIPVTLFEGLGALEKVSLKGNDLKLLPSGLFHSNTLLLELNLDSNPHLELLADSVFSGLSQLRSIKVETCNLSSISPNLFSSMTKLQTLKMSDNKIKMMPPELFRNNINLKILLLNFNYLETLPGNLFDHQYSLTVLDLSRNNLKELHQGIFRNLVKLTSLIMAYNNISYLNWDIFTSMQFLERLDLSNNKLQHISNFGLSSGLKKVDLSKNQLTLMPEIKEAIHMQIQEINLEHNNISFLDVPVLLSDMASVRLGWNDISRVDIDGIVTLYNVNQLSEPHPTSQRRMSPRFYLFPNPIQCDCQIYHFVSYITATEKQYSDQTPLAAFPFSQNLICNQPDHLAGKKLRDIPLSDFLCPTMKDCPLPCSCYKATQDNKLAVNCSYRGLENLPSTVPWNTRILNFSGNRLHTLNDLNRPIWENLTELHLENNSLNDFGAWNFKQNLTYISLQRNAFSHLPVEFMNYVSGISKLKISLGNNPWKCSCSVIDMKGWLIENSKKISDVNNIYCLNNTEKNDQVNVLRVSKESLCSVDMWPHKRQLIIVCCLVVVIPFVLFIALVLYYRNRKDLKTIFSAKSHFFYGERWLWKKFRGMMNHNMKSMPEVPSQVVINSNPDLLMFVKEKISSLNSIPESRKQDKPVVDGHPNLSNSVNVEKIDVASTECMLPSSKYTIPELGIV